MPPAADHSRLEPLEAMGPDAERAWPQPVDPIRGHGLAATLELEIADKGHVEHATHLVVGRAADQHGSRLGAALEPRCDVDRVPGRPKLIGYADVAHLDETGVDSDAQP